MKNVKLHTEVADNFSPTLRSAVVKKTKTGVYLQSSDYRRFVTYATLDIMIYGI